MHSELLGQDLPRLWIVAHEIIEAVWPGDPIAFEILCFIRAIMNMQEVVESTNCRDKHGLHLYRIFGCMGEDSKSAL
jgi:hypothetical protein